MAGKTLSVEPLIDPTAKLQETHLGAYCEVGAAQRCSTSRWATIPTSSTTRK